MAAKYHLSYINMKYGPFTNEEVRKWIKDNKFSAFASCRVDDSPEMKPLNKMEEFSDLFAKEGKDSHRYKPRRKSLPGYIKITLFTLVLCVAASVYFIGLPDIVESLTVFKTDILEFVFSYIKADEDHTENTLSQAFSIRIETVSATLIERVNKSGRVWDLRFSLKNSDDTTYRFGDHCWLYEIRKDNLEQKCVILFSPPENMQKDRISEKLNSLKSCYFAEDVQIYRDESSDIHLGFCGVLDAGAKSDFKLKFTFPEGDDPFSIKRLSFISPFFFQENFDEPLFVIRYIFEDPLLESFKDGNIRRSWLLTRIEGVGLDHKTLSSVAKGDYPSYIKLFAVNNLGTFFPAKGIDLFRQIALSEDNATSRTRSASLRILNKIRDIESSK
jgi:hypothetical protein